MTDLDFVCKLCVAIKGGEADAVDGMLALVSDVDEVHDTGTDVACDGATLLHYAASVGREDVVRLLLARGARQLPDDIDESTPLHKAAESGSAAAAAALVLAGALVDARDEAGRTPLFVAAQAQSCDVAELLVRHGADPFAADEGGECPIWVACTDEMRAAMGYTKCRCAGCVVGRECDDDVFVVRLEDVL